MVGKIENGGVYGSNWRFWAPFPIMRWGGGIY